MIEIDGSQGEGGGQILRTTLALSVLTGQAVRLIKIRAGRAKPGLMAQHLKSVEAAAAISSAQVEGSALHSQTLEFSPAAIRPGRYRFEIGTAGAAPLVLQTVLVPLARAEATSRIEIKGGTHVPHAPCFEYLAWQWLPTLENAGFQAQLELERAGFYPPGGGSLKAVVKPATAIKPQEFSQRGNLVRIQGISAVSNLDLEIAKRQKLQALRRLETVTREVKIKDLSVSANSPGTYLVIFAQYEHGSACYFALGEKGKRAERVADEAVEAFLAFHASGAALDQYLADQLLLPLALAQGSSVLSTALVTQHLLTNAWVIQRFLETKIEIEGELGQPGLVKIH